MIKEVTCECGFYARGIGELCVSCGGFMLNVDDCASDGLQRIIHETVCAGV